MENNTNTNITAAEKNRLLQELNDDTSKLMVPLIVYITVLMISGVVGNSMVLFYYKFKATITTYSILILLLAAYDLITVLVLPLEITRILYFYTLQEEVLCKILRFVNFFPSVGSILSLLAIAGNRYRAICHWSSTQMGIRTAYIVCIMSALIALLITWPALLLYGLQRLSIQNINNIHLDISVCTNILDEPYKLYTQIFHVFTLGLLIISSIVLIYLYSTIGLKLYLHRKRLNVHENKTLSIKNLNRINYPENNLNLNIETAKQSSVHIDNNRRLTLIFATITAVFLISYVPVFAMIIWKQTMGKHQTQFLSGAGLVAFEIAAVSFLMSSALNPWIYGLWCSNFRQFYFKRFKSIIIKI